MELSFISEFYGTPAILNQTREYNDKLRSKFGNWFKMMHRLHLAERYVKKIVTMYI